MGLFAAFHGDTAAFGIWESFMVPGNNYILREGFNNKNIKRYGIFLMGGGSTRLPYLFSEKKFFSKKIIKMIRMV